MAFLIQLFIVAAALTTVLAQNYYSSVLNGTQDYFKIAQAELLYKIKIAEMENNAVEARFWDRLDVIAQLQNQVLNETQQLNETLLPLQALSYGRKYCIQRYGSLLITKADAKDQFEACNKKAQLTGSDLTSTARTFTNSAKSYSLVQLPRTINNNCLSSRYNQTQLEDCYIQYVNMGMKEVQNYLNKAKLQRDQAIFDLDLNSLTTVQCTFQVEKKVLNTLYSTSKMINDCIDGMNRQGIKRVFNYKPSKLSSVLN